jgi:hypothetical protein
LLTVVHEAIADENFAPMEDRALNRQVSKEEETPE